MLRRVVEVAGSASLLVFSSPVFLITAAAIWLTDFGPVFYRQTRAGLQGHPFEMLKFRSMRVNNQPIDRPGEIGESDPLVTTIGRLIRRLKVDELPQLVNVLRGEMSWVGPRPTVLAQVERYNPFQRRRLDVLPGLTGWAQVNGGAEISWDDRIALEVWYVEHRSFWLDVKILCQTASVILFGHKPNPQVIKEAWRYAQRQTGVAEQKVRRRDCSVADDERDAECSYGVPMKKLDGSPGERA
jgi:lipopolysaccharide/colanic/teichoic acid biosynthesis glycosyltransferase